MDGFHNIVELCSSHKLKLFCPSTIGAFGVDSPKVMCPDLTIQRPNTVYGVSKVHMELLGEVGVVWLSRVIKCSTLRMPSQF